jgi:hypothetical protein
METLGVTIPHYVDSLRLDNKTVVPKLNRNSHKNRQTEKLQTLSVACFEVLTELRLRVPEFWDVTPCGCDDKYFLRRNLPE